MNSWQASEPLTEPATQNEAARQRAGAGATTSIATGAPLTRAEIWLRRLGLIVFILVCLEVGMLLLIAPWTHLWSDNALLLRSLPLRAFAMHAFVRGAVSGLGLINLWMGIWEGVHYQEPKAG